MIVGSDAGLFSATFLHLFIWVQPGKVDICDLARPACRHGNSMCLRRFSNALPTELFSGLKANISAEKSVDGWMLRTSPATSVYEQAALALAEVLGLTAADWESVEYWNHDWSRYEGAPWKNYHFDILEPSTCYAHPTVSSILYLDSMGPPTVVLSKSLSDMPLEAVDSGPNNSSVFLSWPESNHWLAFSGDLAHGVLWRKLEQLNSGLEPDKKRRVILFAYWRHALTPPHTFDRKVRKAEAPPLGIFAESSEVLPGRRNLQQSAAVEVGLHSVSADAARHEIVATIEDPMDVIKLDISFRVVGSGDSIEGCKLDTKTWERECEYEHAPGPFLEIPQSIANIRVRQPRGLQGGIFGQPPDAMFGPGRYELGRDMAVNSRADHLEGTVADLSQGALVDVVEVVYAPAVKAVRGRIERPEGCISLVSTADGTQWATKQQLPRAPESEL